MKSSLKIRRVCDSAISPLLWKRVHALVAGVWLAVVPFDVRAQASFPAASLPLTTARQLRQLTPEEARSGLPVRLRAVVNVVGGDQSKTIFIQDETGGTFLAGTRSDQGLEPGTLIEITGKTYVGLFVTGIKASTTRVLGRGELPAPVPASFDDLVSGRLHYQRVVVAGVVRAVTLETNRLTLQIALGPRKLEVQVQNPPAGEPPPLVDARVRVTGLAAGYINDKRQLVAPQLVVHSMNDIKVEQPVAADPFAAPAITVAQLLNFDPAGISGHRVKVRGVVTHQQPGLALFVRDEGRGLLVQALHGQPVLPGDMVEVLGFPAMGTFSAILEDAEFRKLDRGAVPQPVPTTIREALKGTNDADLVSIEAQLLEVLETPAESVLVLRSADTPFNARLARGPLALRNGSRLRLTGVCRVEESVFPGSGFRANPRTIELLLRSTEDIAVLAAPSWWTAQRLAAATGALIALAVGALIWVVLLRRRVVEQTEVIRQKIEREAMLEERQRVAREIHDTLAQSFSGLGFQLEAIDAQLPGHGEAAKSRMETARQMVRHGQEEFRRSLMNLRAQELERGSLATALPELARQITAGCGIELRCEVKGAPRGLPEAIEANLLRIGQECLTNAVSHARPKHVEVELAFEAGAVRLRIADDGAGFDTTRLQQAADGHFGWRGIRERAEQIRAKVKLVSQIGKGTEVSVDAPT